MQQHSPKSHLMHLTNMAKKRARRRLLGSIFLLIIALIILLEVTARIKPVAVKPTTVVIETNASNIANAKYESKPREATASNPVVKETTSNAIIISKPISSLPSHMVASGGFKAHVIDIDNNDDNASRPKVEKKKAKPIEDDIATIASEPTKSPAELLAKLSPQIISVEKPQKKLTPDEILNGAMVPDVTKPRFFIQLMASSNKNKLMQMEHELAKHGIKVTMQGSNSRSGTTIYRLRVGPFTKKSDAASKLSEINNQLNEVQNN